MTDKELMLKAGKQIAAIASGRAPEKSDPSETAKKERRPADESRSLERAGEREERKDERGNR
jgi:hypothetical protein